MLKSKPFPTARLTVGSGVFARGQGGTDGAESTSQLQRSPTSMGPQRAASRGQVLEPSLLREWWGLVSTTEHSAHVRAHEKVERPLGKQPFPLRFRCCCSKHAGRYCSFSRACARHAARERHASNTDAGPRPAGSSSFRSACVGPAGTIPDGLTGKRLPLYDARASSMLMVSGTCREGGQQGSQVHGRAVRGGVGECCQRVATEGGDREWRQRAATEGGDREWRQRAATEGGDRGWRQRAGTEGGDREDGNAHSLGRAA
eukprot:356123-Chlamydomonas_euryale.AAC.15